MEDYTEKRIFQGVDIEEREKLLTEHCVQTEHLMLKRHFTEDQMEEKKDKHAEISIEIADEDIKKKKFMDEYNSVTKPLKHDNKVLVQHLKDGFVDEDNLVYAIDNQEDNVMEYYNNLGECVMERTLAPHERQTNIRSITGTHGG